MKFSLSLLFLLALFLSISLGTDDHHEPQDVYDFIIVGVGGGGAVMANRLSEKRNWRILALDKGPEQNFCPQCDNSTAAPNDELWGVQDENFFSQGTDFTFGRLMRGENYIGLGGNTRIFGQIANPASKNFLDQNFPVGWRYNDLLPYYKKMEMHFCYVFPPSETGISNEDCLAYHGANGPMEISPVAPSGVSQIAKDFINATSRIGYPFTPDYMNSSERNDRTAFVQYFRRRAVKNDITSFRSRESTYTGYILPVENRTNLHIQLESRVIKLLTDATGKVYGVKYIYKGQDIRVAIATKEVIVSAGVFRTPQLLQQSGIGPSSVLTPLGIPVVADNVYGKDVPYVYDDLTSCLVGANYTFHPGLFMLYGANQDVPYNTSLNGFDYVLLNVVSGLKDSNIADLQIQFYQGLPLGPRLNTDIEGPVPAFLEYLNFATGNFKLVAFGITNVQPTTNGNVNIITANPLDHAIIPGLVDDAHFAPGTYGDSVFQLGMNIVRNLTSPASPFGSKYVTGEVLPGAGFLDSDMIYREYAIVNVWHDVGTCGLGRCTDLSGKVKGVQRLRVCDNSIHPAIPDANPTYTLMAICEKMADLIKEEWN